MNEMATVSVPRPTREIIVLDDDDEREPAADEQTFLGFNPQLGGAEKNNYDRQLDHERRKQKRKLKSRFEHIFAKYGKDFDGIGDEIDMQSGVIIVDNGHLRNMQHEVDPGNEEPPATAAGDSEQAKDINGELQVAESDGDAGDDEEDSTDLDEATDSVSDSDEDTLATPPEEILEQMPSLRESVLDLQIRQRQGEGIDQDAIEALGMSIAKQLTNLMSRQPKKAPKRKRMETTDVPAEKRLRRSLSPSMDWPDPSPGRKSLWAPLKLPRRQLRKPSQRVSSTEATIEPGIKAEDANIIPADQLQQQPARRCYNCNVTVSVIWRKGPDGIMCNACGMYHYRYGLVRQVGPTVEAVESSTSEESETESDSEDAESQYSANTSRHRDQLPQNKHDKFQDEEDVLILKLKEIDRLSWEKIAKHLPARTAYAVQCRYSKRIHNKPIEARAVLANRGYDFQHDANGLIVFTPAPAPRGFTDEEDERLLKMREEEKLDWEIIALSFPERTPKALELRFDQLVKTILKALRNPKKVNKPRRSKTRMNLRYSEEEDMLLKHLREVDKLSWAELAERFPGRNAISLQKRYVREISEAAKMRQLYARGALGGDGDNIKHLRYTLEEDALLMRLRDQDGLSWLEIEDRMPGRLKISIQQRYEYVRTRRAHTNMLQGLVEEKQFDETAGLGFFGEGALSDDELMNDDVDASFLMLTSAQGSFQDPMSTNAAGGEVARPARAQSETRQVGGTRPTKADVPKRGQSEPPVALSRSRHSPLRGMSQMNRLPRRWTAHEDALLQKLRTEGMDWEQIALRLPGRTPKAIKSHYQQRIARPRPRHIVSTVQSTGTSNLLRIALGNTAVQRSGSMSTLEGSTANIVDLTDDEDHLSLHSPGHGLRRTDIPRSRKPFLTRRTTRSPPEAVVSEQRKMLPPSVFAPPRPASHASLSPVKNAPPVMGCRPLRAISVLDGLPKVPSIFRTGAIELLSAGQNSRKPREPSSQDLDSGTMLIDYEFEPASGRTSLNATESANDTTDASFLTTTDADDSTTELFSKSGADRRAPQMTDIIDLSMVPSPECSRPGTRDNLSMRASEPQTPLLRSSSSSPGPTLQSAPGMEYYTPSRYDVHAHPYFVAPPARMFIAPEAEERTAHVSDTNDNYSDKPSDRAGELADSNEDIAAELQSLQSHIKHPRRSTRNVGVNSNSVYDLPVSDEEDETRPPKGVTIPAKSRKCATRRPSNAVSVEEGPDAIPISQRIPSRAKRGRPKKVRESLFGTATDAQDHVRDVSNEQTDQSDVTMIVDELQVEEHNHSLEKSAELLPPITFCRSNEELEPDFPPVRRKRGRPRKVWQSISSAVLSDKTPDPEASVETAVTPAEDTVAQVTDEVGDVAEPPEDTAPTQTSEINAALSSCPSRLRRSNRARQPRSSFSDVVFPSMRSDGKKRIHSSSFDDDEIETSWIDDGDIKIPSELPEEDVRSKPKAPATADVLASADEDEDELSMPIISLPSSAHQTSIRSQTSKTSSRSDGDEQIVIATSSSSTKPAATSDINREPERTPSRPITRSHRHLTTIASSSDDSHATSTSNAAVILPSSSPAPVTKRPPKTVYSRTSTPGTEYSTLFGRPEHGRVHALRSSFGSRASPAYRNYRSSSVGLPGSRKRIVDTPARDGDDSEDELA